MGKNLQFSEFKIRDDASQKAEYLFKHHICWKDRGKTEAQHVLFRTKMRYLAKYDLVVATFLVTLPPDMKQTGRSPEILLATVSDVGRTERYWP